MAYSFVQYTANGSLTEFNITFSSEPGISNKPYLSSSHLEVYLDAVKQSSGYSIDETGATPKVVFSSAPSNNVIVKIQRVTPKTAAGRLVDFEDGSILTEADLDNAVLQNLYIAQEAQDVGIGGLAKDASNTTWNADSLRISTLGTAVADNDAVTKGYVDSLAIYGGGTTNPQVWKFTASNNTTSSYTLTSPTPASTRNEVYVVYVDGIVQAPSANDGTTVRDYKITETNGLYGITFESGAFPSNTGNTNCPPQSSVIYIQNFGITRNVFDAPLVLTSSQATDTPMTLKGASGQSAKILEIKNSDNVVKASIDNDGDIIGTDVIATGYVGASGPVFSGTGTIHSLSGDVFSGSGNVYSGSGDVYSTSGDLYATAGDVKASAGKLEGLKIQTTGLTASSNEIKGQSITAVGTLTGASASVTGSVDAGTVVTTGDVTVGGDLNLTGGLTGTGSVFAYCRFHGRDTDGACTIRSNHPQRNVSSIVFNDTGNYYDVTFTNARPDGSSYHFAVIQSNFASSSSDTSAVYAHFGETSAHDDHRIKYIGTSSTSLRIYVTNHHEESEHDEADFHLIVF